MSHHTLTYRTNGEVTVIKIRGDRDIGKLLDEVQRRLFTITPEERAKQSLHAAQVLAGRK